MLQNSRNFAEQRLRAPILEKHTNLALHAELQKQINRLFLDKVVHMLEDFSDWRLKSQDSNATQHSPSGDVYCKLLTKRHLLLIQIPSKTDCTLLLEKHDSIKINYHKFS